MVPITGMGLMGYDRNARRKEYYYLLADHDTVRSETKSLLNVSYGIFMM